MEDSEESVQNIYIELELIIDIYSLLFSIIRINLINKHNIFIINKDITYLYGKNLKQGVIDLLRYVGNGSISEKEIDAFIIDVIKSFVETFSSTLKPTVPSIHVIRELRKNKNLTLSSFTHFDIDDLQGIMKDEFIDMFECIYPFNEFLNYIASINKEQSLIVFGSRNKFNEIKSVISEENISFINVKLPMEVDETSLIQEYKSLDLIPFENYGLLKLSPLFEGTLHKFDLNKDLNTPELQFWDKTVSIEGILLTGKVVHGFQRGSKQLGVPTSNIEMTKENIDLINKLLPGVYSGISYFINSKVNNLDSSIKYRAAISIGWNPSYDCVERTIEAFLLEDFDFDFYDEEMCIEITHFIRAESNYSCLDHLIMAIHNDIEATKKIVKI